MHALMCSLHQNMDFILKFYVQFGRKRDKHMFELKLDSYLHGIKISIKFPVSYNMQHAEFVHSTIHSCVFAYCHVIVHKKKEIAEFTEFYVS